MGHAWVCVFSFWCCVPPLADMGIVRRRGVFVSGFRFSRVVYRSPLVYLHHETLCGVEADRLLLLFFALAGGKFPNLHPRDHKL